MRVHVGAAGLTTRPGAVAFHEIPAGDSGADAVVIEYLEPAVVSGRVTDEAGNPLAAVRLVSVPTSYLFTSGEDGHYTARIAPRDEARLEAQSWRGRSVAWQSEVLRMEPG